MHAACCWLQLHCVLLLPRARLAVVQSPLHSSTQDIERVKAAVARPGALTGALNYYRAVIAQGTKWALDVAER